MLGGGRLSHVVKVHIIHPLMGYIVEDWAVGEEIDQEIVDLYKDPASGNLYAIVEFKQGKKQTTFV